jgi:hypothetical protein
MGAKLGVGNWAHHGIPIQGLLLLLGYNKILDEERLSEECLQLARPPEGALLMQC